VCDLIGFPGSSPSNCIAFDGDAAVATPVNQRVYCHIVTKSNAPNDCKPMVFEIENAWTDGPKSQITLFCNNQTNIDMVPSQVETYGFDAWYFDLGAEVFSSGWKPNHYGVALEMASFNLKRYAIADPYSIWGLLGASGGLVVLASMVHMMIMGWVSKCGLGPDGSASAAMYDDL
jgi:hypothetical protein